MHGTGDGDQSVAVHVLTQSLELEHTVGWSKKSGSMQEIQHSYAIDGTLISFRILRRTAHAACELTSRTSLRLLLKFS